MNSRHWLVMALLSTLLTACGGGDNGDSGNNTTTGTPNNDGSTGINGNAVIDAQNAQAMVEGAFGSFGGGAANGGKPLNTAGIGSMTNLMVYDMDLTGALSAPGQDVTTTKNCTSGTMEQTVNYDSAAGDIAGTVTFNQCKEHGITFNGPLDFSGDYDAATGGFTWRTLQLKDIATTVNGDTRTLSGDTSISLVNDALTTLSNLTITDNSTGKSEKLENYEISGTDCQYLTGQKNLCSPVWITGRYYDANNQRIDIKSIYSLYTHPGDSWPSHGKMQLLGSNGSIQISPLNNREYTMEVDADGDGNYETTETKQW